VSLGIIEINDAQLRGYIDTQLAADSPGYAVMDGNNLLIGNEGVKNARLLPRWTNNRFWNQLSTDPIPNATQAIRHHADLAFAHLESVWQSLNEATEVILAVPGFYSRQQLGLLLGMARESNIPVTGMIDSSLASTSGEPIGNTILHLDIFLHRTVLTILTVDETLRRVDTVTVAETGLFTLWDRWANIIANQFIQAHRYDPMHQAVSEQVLYDQLPAWIQNLSPSQTNSFELNVGNNRHAVAVSQEQLLTACSTVYPQIVQTVRDRIPRGDAVQLFLSHRFRGFPGLSESLDLIDNAQIILLPDDAVFSNIEHFATPIGGAIDNVSHVTSLPVQHTIKRVAAPVALHPTHLLLGHHANPIGNVCHIAGISDNQLLQNEKGLVCTVYTRGKQVLADSHDGDRVQLNGAALSKGTELHIGDQLTIDGQPVTLIAVG
jgi:hypothetical protein